MKRSVSFILLCVLALTTFAQKDVIITIGDHQFTMDEYERIYRKNNTQLNDESDVKSPKEYVDLFIDYKLKVIEAENHGIDTTQAFINELAGYREELAKPYLTDVTVTDSMVRVAYERTINEIEASHILINVDPNASPADTLSTYNKIIDIRNQFLSGDKTFGELAAEYSDDPSAKRNMGYLGYFKAFNMLVTFEDAAYNTPVGEVSMPVRTQYGYHIIHVTDRQKNEGEIKVAHIMKMYSNRNNVSPEEEKQIKNEIDSLYHALKNGADFAKMAYDNSDDRSTKNNSGEMKWITKTFNVKEFVDAAFAIEEIGAISEPVKTPFGWHIIKLIDRREPLSFEEQKAELTQRVKSDSQRSKHSKDAFYRKKKKEHNFKAFDENLQKFRDYLNSFEDTISKNIDEEILALPLFKVADSVFTVETFFILQDEKKKNDSPYINHIVLENLELYENEAVKMYENSILEEKHPEFAQIMQEYRDGMLLFAIMQQEVWDEAVKDTTGLKAYYNSLDEKYTWDKHFDGLLIKCNNKEVYDSCQALLEKGITSADSLKSLLNEKKKINIRIREDKWEKGDNEKIDYLVFGEKVPLRFDPELEFIHGETVEQGKTKKLDEARGLYIADYQEVLEDEWMEELGSKYKIKVKMRLLKKIESVER